MPNSGGDQQPITVAVIDAHQVIHVGVRAWLAETRPVIEVVGDFMTAEDFMAVCPDMTPSVDVVVFGFASNGRAPDFDALHQLCQAGQRVVVYSHLLNDEIILASLEAGAVSYVAKSESCDHLLKAICAACTDTPYVAPRMGEALLTQKTTGRPGLSRREREVLIAWCQLDNKDLVAKKLSVEASTVRTHLQRARTKYALAGRPATTKAAMIARAVQDGIVSVDEL